MTEQRYKAVLAVISDGRTVTQVARDWDVSRPTWSLTFPDRLAVERPLFPVVSNPSLWTFGGIVLVQVLIEQQHRGRRPFKRSSAANQAQLTPTWQMRPGRRGRCRRHGPRRSMLAVKHGPSTYRC